jgi:hypothetical protein
MFGRDSFLAVFCDGFGRGVPRFGVLGIGFNQTLIQFE